jgi:transposase
MSVHPLLPDPDTLTLESLRAAGGVIVFAVRTTSAAAACPLCAHPSERTHSRYTRTLLDLPWQGNAVRVELTVRRLFCDNQECPRRIFAERVPAVAARYARKTCRLFNALRELAYLAGGAAAMRIALAFGMRVSADALLDLLRRSSPAPATAPRVLGMDDFAFRKGHTYGTILVDLERRCPVDLLADREAQTVARWLKEHPGIQIISRDRSETFRNASTQGAPDALQVADRFHLVKNIGDTLKQLLEREHRCLSKAVQSLAEQEPSEAGEEPSERTPVGTATPVTMRLTPSPRAEHEKSCRRDRKQSRYEQVRRLHQQGFSQNAIARQTGLSRKTIRKYLRADTCPHYPPRAPRPGPLQPFLGYLKQRWEAGCHNAAELLREIQAQGYRGKYSILKGYLQPWRAHLPEEEKCHTTGPKTVRRLRHCVPSASTVRWWLLGHVSKADPQKRAWQQAFVERLGSLSPEIAAAGTLTGEFAKLVKERRAAELDNWLERAQRCCAPEMRRFAQGLLGDEAAVRAALSQEWSNGPVEGQVNRLKTVKRAGYGRSGFDLLRARVLPLLWAA